jgi:hypothetical protein
MSFEVGRGDIGSAEARWLEQVTVYNKNEATGMLLLNLVI